MSEKTVFISYRRDATGKSFARALKQELTHRGYDVFLDVDCIDAGKWAEQILTEVPRRSHFLLLLTPGALDRCAEVDDWVRREFEAAVQHGRNIVPVREESVDPAKLRKECPECMKGVFDFQIATIGHSAFERDVEMLVQRYIPPHTAPPPASRTGGEDEKHIAPSRLRHGAEELFGRKKELAALDAALADPKVHVLSIVAWGGVGKTALVVEWLNRLSAQGWPGVDRVFDWSFYSQGTRETGSASADTFIREALIFFGDRAMADSGGPADRKGARLAELIAQRPSLLVLDGVEPLQAPKTGELRDLGLHTLLLGLARQHRGLCLITTRERVQDLESGLSSVTPELQLEHLEDADGARLLHQLGVRKAGAATIASDDRELQRASQETGGHALTLRLLGSYLAEAHGGDVRRRDRVDLGKADEASKRDEQDTYGHAFKVIAAYEKWLAGGGAREQRQLALLRLTGFFDRPADPGCVAGLLAGKPVRGLTEPLRELSEEDWNSTVNGLEKFGLAKTAPYEPKRFMGYSEGQAKKRMESVARGYGLPLGEPQDFDPPSPNTWPLKTSFDAHPLLREYFAKQLGEQNPTAWREGHRRLYEHLKASVPYWPDSLDGLQPLYQAVTHGCLAGLHQEACDEVFRDRIQRGREYYSAIKLGALGADLGAVACFFEQPWTRLSSDLSEPAQAWLLNEAATRLRALGRLTEALEPMRMSGEMDEQRKAWKGAAISYSNLSELELMLGDVAGALRDAEQSVTLADRSGDAFQRMCNRTTHADALHHAGRGAEALARFREAEQMQVKEQPGYPLLYSVPGFHYCDLLLVDAERAAWQMLSNPKFEIRDSKLAEACRSVSDRAARTLPIAERNNWLLDIALEHVTLGRAALYQAVLARSSVVTCHAPLDSAIPGLRAAGTTHHVPRGLLTRAWLRALEGDLPGAHADLDEAWQIAERGSMKLHMADIHLHRARLFRDKSELSKARALIEACGYWRRKEELEDAEAAAKNW